MTGTYTGSYTTIFPGTNASIFLTPVATVEGAAAPAAIYDKSQFETVTNLGVVADTAGVGVLLTLSGDVVNGADYNYSASISGKTNGIEFESKVFGSVTNFGTITATTSGAGIDAAGGAVITNSGTVSGYNGIVTNTVAKGGAATVVNSGTIHGVGRTGVGVYISTHGVSGTFIDNQLGGLIEGTGGPGVEAYNTAITTVTNLGTIETTGTKEGSGLYLSGVYIGGKGTITNGSAGDTSALIGGYAYGAGNLYDAVTIVNFGTIASSGTKTGYGYSVAFTDSATVKDRLIDEPGAVFIGVHGVYGGGPKSTLELASGSSAGTIGGLYSTYENFGTIEVDSGAQWDVTGSNTVSSFTFTGGTGDTKLEVYGTLTIESGATLDFAKGGKLLGTGTLDVYDSTLDLGVKAKAAILDFTGLDTAKIEFTQGGTYKNIHVGDFGLNDTILLDSRKWVTGDTAVYVSGTIELKSSKGKVLDSFAATEGLGVGGLTVADIGGKAAIETQAILPDVLPPFSIGHSHTNSADALLDGARSVVGAGGEADHHGGRLETTLAIGAADHL